MRGIGGSLGGGRVGGESGAPQAACGVVGVHCRHGGHALPPLQCKNRCGTCTAQCVAGSVAMRYLKVAFCHLFAGMLHCSGGMLHCSGGPAGFAAGAYHVGTWGANGAHGLTVTSFQFGMARLIAVSTLVAGG